MLDGDPATGWSNAFAESATALLPAFSGAREEDWVPVEGAVVGWAAASDGPTVVAFDAVRIGKLEAPAGQRQARGRGPDGNLACPNR